MNPPTTLTIVDTFDFEADADGPSYLNATAREAVLAAYTQSMGFDFDPAKTEAIWGHLVVETETVVRCVNFTACKELSHG